MIKIIISVDNATNICGLKDLKCYDNAEKKSLLIQLEKEMKNPEKKQKRIEGECDCLPSCTSIQYDAEVSQADFNWIDAFKSIDEGYNENAE